MATGSYLTPTYSRSQTRDTVRPEESGLLNIEFGGKMIGVECCLRKYLDSVLSVISDMFCDEVHFWLNGYVNKQNCSIWSEANPQVYVETTLHPEKLTVWCGLWAGGILLQKR
ncbi:uncharacterized protein TNCV_1634721 [Trichonephila clavipes]|nr:uncharacterized protein TNCV_1634721 [Trichonephila clavipes]